MHHFLKPLNRGFIFDFQFYHIAVRKIPGRSELRQVVRIRQPRSADCLHDRGQTVAAAVFDIESPASTRQTVDRIEITEIESVFTGSIILSIRENHSAKGVTGVRIGDCHGVRETTVEDAQLHATNVGADECGEGARVGVAQERVVRDNRCGGLLVGGLDGEHRMRVHPCVTALTVIEQRLHPDQIRTVINCQSVSSACVIPAREMYRVGIQPFVIDTHIRQPGRQGIQNRPDAVCQCIQHLAVVVASGSFGRKPDVET